MDVTEIEPPVRVLLADDHTMFREGLAAVLASYGGVEILASVPNDREVLDLARKLRPDVVIMEVRQPLEEAKETLEDMRLPGATQGGDRHDVRESSLW